MKKANAYVFGFKQQTAVDANGLVVGLHTVPASQHDSKGLAFLVEKLDDTYLHNGVYANKGYKTSTNDALLKDKKIKNRVMHKAYRNKPLTNYQQLFNSLVSKKRWVVERTFGSIKKWLGGTHYPYSIPRSSQNSHPTYFTGDRLQFEAITWNNCV